MNNEQLEIKRTFQVKRDLVFEAFTQPEHLKMWWGPKDFKIDVLAMNLKVGGHFHYKMYNDSGHEMYGLFTFKEINPPQQLVFDNAFADKDGNIVKAPFEMDLPLLIENRFTFEEVDGTTIMTMVSTPIAKTESELQAFIDMKEGMKKGYKHSIDQLELYMNEQFRLRQENKKNTNKRVCHYLNFPGNTEKAMLFYKEVFKGEFVGAGIQRFGDIRVEHGGPPASDENKNLVLHAELQILDNFIIMATDAPESMGFVLNHGNNMHIYVEPGSRDETTRIFNELSVNAKVDMPLADMFFGAYFGSLTDQFGINWMFSHSNETQWKID
jgi:uncharacterized glyoxalase superfamily protein PhnB/uncharacterized protein YndB with AHSA1/START domain